MPVKRTGLNGKVKELGHSAEPGVSVEEGKSILHELVDAKIPAWLHPGTDYLASFPPFNNQPTQYRITVRGEQKWFAQ